MKQYNWHYFYRLKIGAIFLALFLLIPSNLLAQSDSSKNTKRTQQTDSLVNADSLLIVGKIVPVKEATKYYSPEKASMYSAVLPGMGQIYNKTYWKVPIIWGALGIAGYFIYSNKKNYTLYSNAYRDYVLQDPGNTSYLKILNDPKNGLITSSNGLTAEDFAPGGQYSQWFVNSLNNQKAYSKKNLDYSYLFAGAIYILNIIDASVDAHFKEFDISDDLTLNWDPIFTPRPDIGTTYGMSINLSFK